MKASYDGWNVKTHDEMLPKFISTIKKHITLKSDDYLLMCVGETGTGKSTLMLEAMELFNPSLDVSFVGLNPQDHAQALRNAKEYDGDKFCSYDEANIQKRNSTTKYNKALIDLYLAIRGLKIFHWWNNPSLDIIDKFFIQEKINAVVYVASKDINFPRVYYVFHKDAILNIYDRCKGKLTLKVLKKHAPEYATYKGWFKSYSGENWKAYCNKKNERMDEKVDDFYSQYGDKEKYTKAKLAKEFNTSDETIRRKIKILKTRNEWIEGEDFILNGVGYECILEQGKTKIKSVI